MAADRKVGGRLLLCAKQEQKFVCFATVFRKAGSQ
jgi:hypothetical protein